MRTIIGLFCVLAVFLAAPGCSGSPTTTPADGDAQQEETKAPTKTDGAKENKEETTDSTTDDSTADVAPGEEPVDEAVPAGESEEIVETFDTEARPSLLLRIMLKPLTDAMESQASSLNLPGAGG